MSELGRCPECGAVVYYEYYTQMEVCTCDTCDWVEFSVLDYDNEDVHTEVDHG